MRIRLVVLTALTVAGCANSGGGGASPSVSTPGSTTPTSVTPTVGPSGTASGALPSTPGDDAPSRLPGTPTQPPAGRSSGPDSTTQVFADCRTPVVRPATIVLACADAGVRITAISWREWGTDRAVGTGTLEYNDCTPDCAQGTYHSVPGTTLTLGAAKDVGDGLVVWSQISEDPLPPGYRPGPQSLPLHSV